MRRRAILLALLLLASPAARAEGFLRPGAVDLTILLAPPPAPDSETTRAELAELARLQAEASPARVAQAAADVEETPFRFLAGVVDGLSSDRLPRTAAFFARLGEDEAAVVDPAKDVWNRTRPWLLAPEAVRPLVRPSRSGSYPSGHATRGTLMAIVLAQMLPERRAALFARARDYQLSREIGGMHFPSDVEAGRIAGTVIAQAELGSPEYRAAYAEARAELRAALGLAP